MTIVTFILPALVLFCLLVLAPILLAMYASVFKWNGFGILPQNFVGLDNFTRMFQDEIFLGDLWRGLVLVILSLVVQLPLALGVALLLNQPMRGRAVYRLLFFAPYVISEVIAAVLFTMVFSEERGLANRVLDFVGLDALQSTWLSDPSTVMYTLFIVMTWKYFGFHMIIYLAGRQSIPNEVIEAAAIDGANNRQIFRHVTLPLLGPTIRISIFLSVIGAIQLFDLVWVLTGGGPVHASETMAVTMFEYGFKRYQVGYASAISVVMFILSLVFALGYQRWVMSRDTQGAITNMRDQR
ncbi:raffinose/stachyose/melibiose transport system permease protein [Thermocatellispora tengchongensis]|uniref:Raffinose/stachyose/melibiose transport system permease protein n=1 Tax=Thermocatellispora tengchongensis TaxID=1073253 RepID=A0A840NYE4_9ACTN|nr:sugar ABC transporter permease [Thermocatellispora tengchongensis]MBB5132202.1 raffinose/stachyose/melibiose transport system permease protein [Thermocatellispora tengchongensis]